MRKPKIPDAAIRRLPVYLRALQDMVSADIPIVSSAELAEHTEFSPEQIRKDLAYFGAFGTRGVGYDVALLTRRISRILGLQHGVKAALVGAGHLGFALARYSLSKLNGVSIAAIFDNDPGKVGQVVNGVRIHGLDALIPAVRSHDVKIGIITVPAEAAQETVDLLHRAGVEAVLNFAPAKLKVPPGVFVQNIDLTIELQSLAYYTSAGAADEGETRAE